MTSLLAAPPAASQLYATSPALTAVTLTSTSVVQGGTLAYVPSSDEITSVNSAAFGSIDLAGATSTVSVFTGAAKFEDVQGIELTYSAPAAVPNPSPDVASVDIGSPVGPQLLPSDAASSSAKAAGSSLSAQPTPAANFAFGFSTGAQPVAAPALVTPSVVSAPSNQVVDLQSIAFRISRTPADASPLQVTFVQTAYGPTGAVAAEGIASFVPGSANVDIPLAWGLEPSADSREIVTLALRPDARYRVAQPTATLFLVDATRRCSDNALFEAFRRGQSTEAFNALFQVHRSAVFQTCLGLLRNMADAEDVTQVVFLMLARQPMRLGLNMAGWLRTVARHASIGFLRSRSRRVRHEKNAAKAEQIHGDDEAADLRDELETALEQLAPDLRDAVRLRYLEGWTQQQAAERLGCPRGTLSQRAARGVQSLRDILGCTAE